MSDAENQKKTIVMGIDITDFWNAHGKNLALILLLVVLVIVVIGGYSYNKQRKAFQAARLLESAKNVQDFQDIASRYEGTPAAAAALLALGQAFYNEGMYDRAIQQYEMFLTRYAEHPLVKAAELGKVLCYEGMGDVSKALDGFATFVMMNPKHFLTPQAMLGKGRCLQLLGRYDEARTVYEDFIVAYTNSQWADQAKVALTLMEKDIRAKQRTSLLKKNDKSNSLQLSLTNTVQAK